MKSTASIVIVWLLVAALIYWAFDAMILRQHNPNSIQITSQQSGDLVLKRSRDGHFRLSVLINGEPIVLMVDTGASNLTLDDAQAQRLNLSRGDTFMTQTANGSVMGYASMIETLDLGTFQLRNVPIGVIPKLGDEGLLGMNVLKNFAVQIQGDQMTIRSLSILK
ncbi:retroviral-like aspartic protease family protein [Chitinibacter bivalviorum]|uniref:Retroviral-like aspartic protease family protein n=1 Tax=Chitinibacter bivalviorum TaxID=2739434 RepID=A0A7H9BH72_9NEIS|nr:retropepsin-like aspartic protease [Chitinibacter bivalviorum]QLG87606.1 retroviral-like aspartic protease family protein [Chitinibacter bivalviorum]